MFAFFFGLSRVMAWLGGAMLALLVVMVCASILGRQVNAWMFDLIAADRFVVLADWVIALGIGPIKGDFELIEAGVAFTIFAFLPYCHMTDGHARVDIFTRRLSPRSNRMLRALADVMFAAVMVLIAVQLWGGMQSKMRSGQTTFLLEFPVWWAYALSMTGAFVAAVVSSYVALARMAELATGRVLLPEMGPEP